MQGVSEVVVRVHIVRRQCDRSLEGSDGLVEFALRRQRNAQVIVRFGIPGP